MKEEAAAQRQYKGLDLDGPHARLLQRSAITLAVAKARGYRTVRTKAALKGLGFTDPQCRVPALLVPIHGVNGEVATYQIRPDAPRVNRRTGKVIKYETPTGSVMVLDIPPPVRAWLGDPKISLLVTEGARKVDSAVSLGLCGINLLGVWNWRGTNAHGGATALADWERVALNGRDAFVCFDSDVMVKREVHAALVRFTAFLESRGAIVRVVYLPPGEGGGKHGLDDWIAGQLATGKDPQAVITGLFALAEEDLRPPRHNPDRGKGQDQDLEAPEYVESPRGLVRVLRGTDKTGHEWEKWILLCNFTARIVGEVVEDDGAETYHVFEIEARFQDHAPVTILVPAVDFRVMGWAIERLGPRAITYPKHHADVPVAIQVLSGDEDGVVPRLVVYTHTGWRQIEGVWVYLHAGGAIGPNGPVAGVDVRLPDALTRYDLPTPPTREALKEAMRASLRVLDVGLDRVTVPTYAATIRASLGSALFSVHLAGGTGVGKTALAVLHQQHYGPGLDAAHIPGSWSSTGNALEGLAFSAKDALLLVDDFAPSGGLYDVQRHHREADRVLRAQGNQSGRARMRADGSLRPPKHPRGVILSTGEDVPRGQSLRARVLVIQMAEGDLDWQRLTAAQADAGAGLYAQTLAAFLQWLAPRYGTVADHLRRAVATARAEAMQSAMGHRRTPDIVAHLWAALDLWLTFAVEMDAVTEDQGHGLRDRAWRALGEAARRQRAEQEATEPTRRFFELLRAALVAGKAHLADRLGNCPTVGNPAVLDHSFGWRDPTKPGDGERIGWVDGPDLYLEPEVSFKVVQQFGQAGGEGLSIGSKTLAKRLAERKLLLSSDRDDRHTARETLEGQRREVLHLRVTTVFPPERTPVL